MMLSLKKKNIMPNKSKFSPKFHRCVSSVQASGKSSSASYAICQVSVNKAGGGSIKKSKK